VEDADAELRKAKLKKEPSETKETKKEDWIQVDSRTYMDVSLNGTPKTPQNDHL